MSNGRIQYIDVWRFIAIALVVVSHLVRFLDPVYQQAMPEIIAAVRKAGVIGVQVFFCISGFVICRGVMRDRESGRVSMRAFYIRRIYRILPALSLYIGCVAVLTSLAVFDLSVYQFLKAATFLCNIREVGPSCSWELGHTWSLAYEEQFYLVFPLLFVCGRMACNARVVVKMASILIPLCLLALIWKNSAVTTYFGHVLFMLMGCLFALYWEKIGPAVKSMPAAAWYVLLMIVVAIGVFPQPDMLKRFYAFVLPVLIGIAVFGIPIQPPAVQWFFSNQVLAHLGRISYSIYLLQQLATASYGLASPLLAAAVLVALTVLFAHYSYHYFELPLVRKGNLVAARYAGPQQVALVSQVDHSDEDVFTKLAA